MPRQVAGFVSESAPTPGPSAFGAPELRAGLVVRNGLVDRLLAADEPVITVTAPPGYGKSTLLAQWAGARGRVAWVSCERSDNDPVALWSTVFRALDGVGTVGSGALRILATSGGSISAVPALVAELSTIPAPVALVLDHLDAITSSECWTALAEFALRVPAGWQLALASREQVAIPIVRLRSQRSLVELGPTDLAMSPGEAKALLDGAGVHLPSNQVDDLVRRTEGWPVALYLGALALKAGGAPDGAPAGGAPADGAGFTGDDRLMGDYLRSELLAPVTEQEADFLVRTCLLDRMSGPLCDAVTGGSGSARMLEQLENRNLLVVPLDRRREWYRYHHLLRDLLNAELRAREPEEIRILHARAADWHDANGMPEVAIAHAQAAGDVDHVEALVLHLMQPAWAEGRIETVRRWMEWLGEARLEVPGGRSTAHYAAIAAHGALVFALVGRSHEAERWAEVAERLPSAGTLPDGSTVAGTLAYLRAILCRQGPAVMRTDARQAADGLSPRSPYRATMDQLEGVSALLMGDLDGADALLAHAYDSAVGVGSPPLVALTLAERFLVASRRPGGMAPEPLLERAVGIVETAGLDGYWSSALVLACAARSAAQHGDIPAARRHARRAARLRPLLTYMLPVVSVQTLVELARAYLLLVDVAGAEAVLDQAFAILQQRPDLGALPEEVARLREAVAQFSGVAAGASSLTTAELRLVPLLPTHLTLREIGDRLYLSRHTVKSQVLSLYRKLGVSSRGEAVARIVALGLHA